MPAIRFRLNGNETTVDLDSNHGPVSAAIANAVFDCLGVRVRSLPITHDSLIVAMEAS